MKTVIRGRVWKFGHDMNTDVMAPGQTLNESWEERRDKLFHTRPGFVDRVKSGDLIVAGRNWGCGSSREQAPENLKLLGLSAVVAESFARIYFRNSIATAMPALACAGVHDAFEEGDEIELDLRTAVVRNLTRDVELKGRPYTADMLAIIEKGGLVNVLRERMRAANR